MEARIQLLKSYCYPIYGCALWRHSYQNSIRKLTVSYGDTFNRLINVQRYTSYSLAFVMNATDPTNVVFRKSVHSLMSRVTIPQTILLLSLLIAIHISSLNWLISGVCYMHVYLYTCILGVVSKQLRLLHGRVGESTTLVNSLSPQMSELVEDAVASWWGDIVGHFWLIRNELQKFVLLKFEFFSFNTFVVSQIFCNEFGIIKGRIILQYVNVWRIIF